MTYPPRPSNITIPAVIAGNVLQNDNTSVSVIDNGFDGSIVMKTENKIGMLINPEQRVSINSESTSSMLTINNDSSLSSTLRLSYQDRFYFDGRITSNGNVLFIPSCDDTSLNDNLHTAFKKNVDIMDHDGSTIGLRLGGTLVTATASELNFVDVPIGVARPNKAIVLNNDLNITGINTISANQINGVILSADQPHITTLHNINITGDLRVKGDLLDIDMDMISLLNIPTNGIAYASKAVILNSSKNISGINSLSANTLSGTLTTGPQPNITSLSSLNSLTNNGPSYLNGTVSMKTAAGEQLILKYSDTILSGIGCTVNGDLVLRSSGANVSIATSNNFRIANHNGSTSGLVLGDSLVLSTASELNYTKVTAGVASANRCLVLDGSRNISGVNLLSASLLVGVLQTAAQPAITSVTTLNITGHNGSSMGLSLGGSIVTASAAKLNYVDTSPGLGTANKALVLNSSSSVSGINMLSANSLSGTLLTEDQPNIKKVSVLTILNHNGTDGLRLGSVLVTSSGDQLNRVDVDSGVCAAGKALVVDLSKNITGINMLTASQLHGTIQTSSQPNINQVNTLNIASHNGSNSGLSLNGILVTTTALQLNRLNVQAGLSEPNKALVLDSALSITGINIISANVVNGVISNSNQPNIRTLHSVNIIDHDGDTVGLSLGGVLIRSTANQLNYVDVQQGSAAPSKALVLNSDKNISGINTITANEFNGIIRTPNQPYINRVSTLNIMDHNGSSSGLSLNGVLVVSTADQLNRVDVQAGVASTNKALVVNESKNISGINILNATSLAGTLLTSNQPNITTVNTLNVNNHNGTVGLSLAGTIVTASATQLNRLDTTSGIAVADKALIVDSLRNITNINTLGVVSISGTIQTSHQPNLSSVNTLDIINHNGGSSGLRLNGVLVSATANQLNSTAVVAGVATAQRALITNEFNSINGINTLSATKLVADQLSLSGVISNLNVGGVIIKSYSFTDLIGRMVNIDLINSLNFSRITPNGMTSGFSCELIGYIRPAYSEIYTFYVTCTDRVRLWVNGELILHSWASSTNTRISSTIFLNAEQWIPIYIQYQVDVGNTPAFLLEWASSSNVRGLIGSARLAWDNNPPSVSNKHFSQNSFTIFNTLTDSANTAKFSVDTGGDLTIDASGNDIILGSSDNLNIPAHDGSTRGLYLGGVLVKPTAYELNYLKVSPGVVSPSQALVVNASKSLTGINSLSATTIACDNLSTNAFTISNLSLSGPLNNYNTGSLLIRQITGPDVSGRVVDVNTITNIDLNNYDPKELNTNFSLDIIGYILPTFTETHRFHAIANDRVRIWVSNTLILNAWDSSNGLEYTSDSILLTAGQWTPIYIQFQNITGSSSLQVRWSSSSLVKSFINNAYMAWDNSLTRPPRATSCADRLTLFSSSSGLTTIQSSNIGIDGNGNMSLDAKTNFINMNSNVNIVTHNGTRGLYLSGSLVSASATEINYLSGVTPGTITASKALILDSSKSISGFTSISSTDFIGTIRTGDQPFITSIGTLSSTLSTSADINVSNSLRISSDSSTSLIQCVSDLFVGNYGSTASASTRKFVIKTNGNVGIQTSSPTRALSVNGGGSTYCMRLINNSNNGSETAFCDIGVDSSSNLIIGSNVSIGSTTPATISVTSNGTLKVTSTSMQIGNTTGNTMPLEVGSTTFSLSASTGFINSEGSTGVTIPTSTSYSIRTTSSIIVNGSVCVTSDKRLKHQIKSLNTDSCKMFIRDSQPVEFSYIQDKTHNTKHYGLIAQDILRSNFADLVSIAPCHGVRETIESDGLVSPSDTIFNVSYEEIIPIVMTALKDTIKENESLKSEVISLKDKLSQFENKLNIINDLIAKFEMK